MKEGKKSGDCEIRPRTSRQNTGVPLDPKPMVSSMDRAFLSVVRKSKDRAPKLIVVKIAGHFFSADVKDEAPASAGASTVLLAIVSGHELLNRCPSLSEDTRKRPSLYLFVHRNHTT